MLVDDGQLSVGDVGGPGDAIRRPADDGGLPRSARRRGPPTPWHTGRTVDGVIALDPHVLAALLGYAGPIQLTMFDRHLDRYNAAQFLLHDQYVESRRPTARRTLSTRSPSGRCLACGPMPEPTTLARDLGPLAADRRLSMWSADPEAQQLLERVGLGGAIPALDGREGWAVTVSNAAGNKIDTFLSAATSYDSSVDAATGRTTAVIRVELTNTAPPSGLPATTSSATRSDCRPARAG